MYRMLFLSLIVLGLSLVLAGCQKTVKWQYKVVTVSGNGVSRTGVTALAATTVEISADTLAVLGQAGWELVDSYLEMETAFPNFGNEDYHTGIKTNIRPQRLVMIFKRRASN